MKSSGQLPDADLNTVLVHIPEEANPLSLIISMFDFFPFHLIGYSLSAELLNYQVLIHEKENC